MKKYIWLLFFIHFLYSFETMGHFWPEKIVWITSMIGGQYYGWVYDATLYWCSKAYDLGPANVDFIFTGGNEPGVVEVEWAGMPLGKFGKTVLYTCNGNCRELCEGVIYMNSSYIGQWTQGRFATVIRHEIGHAAGLADEWNNPNCIMHPDTSWPPQENRPVTQDDVNGLGCLYGGNFNWGNETFTLSEPRGGKSYECKIPVAFGGCNGSGGLYTVKIYVKYDADIPNSPWIHVTTLENARGCKVNIIGRKSSSEVTQVKVEWYSGGVLKDTKISGFFTYIWNPVKCPEIAPPDYQASGCGCESLNTLEGPIPHNFQKIEVFDITGRRILFADKDSRELFINAINDLPEGIYFIRIITKERIYVKKLSLIKNK